MSILLFVFHGLSTTKTDASTDEMSGGRLIFSFRGLKWKYLFVPCAPEDAVRDRFRCAHVAGPQSSSDFLCMKRVGNIFHVTSAVIVLLILCVGCGYRNGSDRRGRAQTGNDTTDRQAVPSISYAKYFRMIPDDSGKGRGIVILSPSSGREDTLYIREPSDRIVCLSSTHLACLAEIGADSVVCAVSGIRYISDKSVHRRYAMTVKGKAASVSEECLSADDGRAHLRPLYDVGYDNSLDYEMILRLKPDLVTAYAVSGDEPQYLRKLRGLGVPVLVLHDHLEAHPLARAEYIRLFGVLTGREDVADSVFASVCGRYESLVCPDSVKRVNVLMNVPFADAWYIPGGDNYMARLVRDAGGEVLGAEAGSEKSGIVSLEKAYSLSWQADIWLDPGSCGSLDDLASVHQLFPLFGPLAKGLPIYNNTLRMTPGGGNDFWERGAVRPDLVLEDLVHIMRGDKDAPLNYHFRLE